MMVSKYRLSEITVRRIKKIRDSLPFSATAMQLREQYRIRTSQQRMLPAFLIVGVMKGGTSSFFRNLIEHPQIVPGTKKEMHYFDLKPDLPFRWYRAQYPIQREDDKITGEATPGYIYHPHTADLIAKMLPDAKFIVLFRNPVSRAYSQYHHRQRRHDDKDDFEGMIRRAMQEFPAQVPDEIATDYAQALLLRGIYAPQLRRWLERFPPERLLILKSEDYYQDPFGTLSSTATDFLGLRPWTPQKYHADAVKRDYPRLDPALRAEMAAFFAPYNQEFYEVAGRDFGWEGESAR